jgi:hypothetical protein
MPKWLLKGMKVSAQEKHKSAETNREGVLVSGRQFGAHGVRFHKVCKACNSGWMSSLELKTQPLLERLMHAVTGKLEIEECQLMATWLYKTLALVSLTSQTNRQNLFLAEDLHYFYRNLRPIGDATVYLCRVARPSESKISIYMPRTTYGLPSWLSKTEADKYERCFIGSLRLGQVLLIYVYINPPECWMVWKETELPRKRKIWPTITPIAWDANTPMEETSDSDKYYVEFAWKRTSLP